MKHDRTIRACSIWRALDVVGDVPVLLIMEQTFLGTHSFDEFVARTGLARSVVNGRLKKLVEEDCLAKVPRKGGRGFHYVLTRKGRDQFPNGLMMLRWQHKWEADSRDFQVRLHHATCGHATEPVPVCAHCHAEIDPRDVDWREGPGLAQVVPHYERRRFNGEIGARRPGGRPLVDTMIELFGDRWATLVVRAMFTRINRFDDIQRDTLMATNILTGRLERLVRQGILKTIPYSMHPDRVEYRLTAKGRDLYPVLLALLQWGCCSRIARAATTLTWLRRAAIAATNCNCPTAASRLKRSARPRDIVPARDYRRSMRTLMRFLIGLLVSLSIGFGSIAHAAEAPASPAADQCVEEAGHTQGDPANDADKMGPHNHGGCHGHHQVGAVGAHNTPTRLPLTGLNFAAGSDFVPQLIPDANLRPPIA